MSTNIVLLITSIPSEERKSMASRISDMLNGDTTVLPIDLSSEEGRQEVRQIFATSQVDIMLVYGSSHDALLSEAKVPVVVVPPNPNLMQIQADVVAYLRACGVNAALVNSWDKAIARVQAIVSPPVLSGKKVLIFGEPFDSATVPCRNLSYEDVFARTGVEVMYRPLETLRDELSQVDESQARTEMDRWMGGASEVVEASPEAILDSCRLYILLKEIVETENLSGVSIDCVRYSFSETPFLPHPCLAFSRLRGEGIAAPCEADLPGMLSSILIEGVSQRPSFLANVAAINTDESTTTLLHCVAPLKMNGYESDEMPYRLRDYHGLGRGVVPDVDFLVGADVTMGAFTKNLQSFVVWPGTIVETGDIYCRNSARIKIKDSERFLQSIAGCHYIMVYGNFARQLCDILTQMNVSVIGPIIC